MALVHDDDLARIDGLGDDAVSGDLYCIPVISYFLTYSHWKSSNQMRYYISSDPPLATQKFTISPLAQVSYYQVMTPFISHFSGIHT